MLSYLDYNISVKSILLVDDDEQLKSTLVTSLAKLGYIVYTSKNGQECIDFIKYNTPSVIVIDCFMPKLDGLSAIKIMQDNKNKIPIIMISSDDIKANGFLFLRKPFKINNLVQMIESLINIKIK